GFQTTLVGVDANNQPVELANPPRFTWISTFNGTSCTMGGTQCVFASTISEPHVPVSGGTGGVTITSIQNGSIVGVNPVATRLAFTSTSPNTSDYHDAAIVSASLADVTTGAPIAGQTVAFQLDGELPSSSCSAVTDATGTASCQLAPLVASGSYTLAASFA